MGVEFGRALADAQDMALRIATRLPRLALVGTVLLLASATLAVGAAKRLTAVPTGAPAPVSAPTITLSLQRTAYPEKGQPEDLSPYAGTVPQLLRTTTVRPAAPIPMRTRIITATQGKRTRTPVPTIS